MPRGLQVRGDDASLSMWLALVLFAVAVGVPLGVHAGQIITEQSSDQLVQESSPPTIPVHREPVDGAIGVSRTPTFDWTAAQDESLVTYTLQYSPDPTFEGNVYEVVVFGLRDSEHTVADEHRLPPGTTIHWRVFAIDAWSNPSGWSETTSFTTGP